MATTKTLSPTNQTITIDAFQGEKPDYRHIADAEGKLADAINQTITDHFAGKGNATTPVSDLSTIPMGFIGNVTLAASISPSGALRSHSLIKFGQGASQHIIIAVDQYANRIYMKRVYSGTEGAWQDMATGIYAFGGLSANNAYSFPMKAMSHAMVFIGGNSTMMYVYDGIIYGATLPSGYTAAYDNGTVTITRDNSTTFVCHGIVIGGT